MGESASVETAFGPSLVPFGVWLIYKKLRERLEMDEPKPLPPDMPPIVEPCPGDVP